LKAKPYKRQKRGGGRHVHLSEWLQASDAWATMKPGPRALYIELRRRFNGANNGDIFLSHRDAAKALNVNRNTATAYFAELVQRGFISMTEGPHLGPSGIGQASKWALEDEPTRDGKPAGKAFMAWRKNDNPSQKIGTPRHEKQDASSPASTETAEASQKPGRNSSVRLSPRPNIGDICTSSHRQKVDLQ
jgi:DNA-binding transcriptional MocR family regulator